MPKVSPSQNNFTAGEFSPFLYGRFDIAKYANGAKTLENILIHQAGGGQRRPGSKYVAEVKTSSLKTRIFTFEFSTTQAYILEMGNEYFRFYRNNGQIQSASAYEISTPYQTADLFDIQFGQDADTMFLTHPNYKSRELTRTGHTAWTLKNYAPELLTLDVAPGGDGWAAGETITGQTSGKTSIIVEVLTGTTYRIKNRDGAYTLDEVLTNGTATADQGAANPVASGDPFGADGSDDCPASVAMFEQRIVFANTNNNPQKIWASVSGDFQDMTVGADAGDAFVYTIASDKVNAIRWLKPIGKSLQMGTLGSTFSLSSGNDAVAVTPTNVSIKRDTTYGAANILPETIGNFIYYVDRDLNHLRELGFSFDIDAQQALDMTILSDHIAKAADPLNSDGFTQIAYQQSPVSRLWCVRNDGQMAVLTRQIDQEVVGWSREVSGVDSLGDGVYESVAIIPTDGGDDEVWVIVKRYIGSAVVRYIEFFMPEKFDHQQDAFFVDSGLSLDNPKTITNVVSKVTIDDMEYASDAAAQAAYVSNKAASSEAVEANTSEVVESFVSILGASGAQEEQGMEFQVQTEITCTKIQVFIKKILAPTDNIIAEIQTDSSTLPSGILVDTNATKVLVASTIDTDYAWVEFEFPDSFTLKADTVYHLVLRRSGTRDDVNYIVWAYNSGVYTYGTHEVKASGTWTNSTGFKLFRVYGTHLVLQSYSEATIIQQGSYSLKAIAKITESLTETLTRTLATAIDLTGVNSIKLSVRAGRTGSNFKIGFHDSGGTTTEHTINIVVADTWQTETIDISGVTTANKDDIDSIIITILDADADNTFYIDNIFSPTPYITVTSVDHGFVDADEIKIVDIIGMIELNNRSFVVDKLTDDTFALKDSEGNYIDGSTYTAYISGGEARKKIITITGLTHLAGEEVAITADGLAVATKIVNSDGEITLDTKASLVHAGLPYITDIALLPSPGGSATGTAIGKKQRTYKLSIKFYRSLGVQFGPDADHLDEISEETLFTGDRIRSFPGDWDRKGLILLRQANPLPLNILSVTIIKDVTDD